ncbi:MAG: acyl-ACP--UDP-N-acetylglucosamine O-acyltransferase [Planctomycetota bacterium]|jgi:UDP-N-acetylglucosamine acyltransferase
MPTVHPTAVLDGDVQLAPDVVVGPNCVLTGPVEVGAGCRLVGNVYLNGPMVVGTGNMFYPFTTIGFAPQHGAFDPTTPGLGVVIGNDNTFREHTSVHRAFTDEGPTTIGDRNMFMVNAHIGHDCRVGADVTLVNNVCLAGHSEVHDRAILGGGASIHQFTRVGRGAMIHGLCGLRSDLPPFFMITAMRECGGLNLVGMRRAGMPREQIDTARWVYRTLYRERRTLTKAVAVLRDRSDDPFVAEYIAFIESSKTGISNGPAVEARAVQSPSPT